MHTRGTGKTSKAHSLEHAAIVCACTGDDYLSAGTACGYTMVHFARFNLIRAFYMQYAGIMHAADDDATIAGGTQPPIAMRVDKVRVEQCAFEISDDAVVSINSSGRHGARTYIHCMHVCAFAIVATVIMHKWI